MRYAGERLKGYTIGRDQNGTRLYLSYDQDTMIWQPIRAKAEQYSSVDRAQYIIVDLMDDYQGLFSVSPEGMALAWQKRY